VLTLQVTDGVAAHSFILDSLSADFDSAYYSETWARGSFLESGRNRAGVSARAVPNVARHWVIDLPALRSVAYSYIVLREEHDALDRFLELLGTEVDSAIAEYRDLIGRSPEVMPVVTHRLVRWADLLLSLGRSADGVKAYRIVAGLHSWNASLAMLLAQSLQATGDTTGAVAQYREALARVPGDSTMTEAKRERARLIITESLRSLGAAP
jgi:hypothetical protein